MTLPLYAKCPRCMGHRYVTAITEASNGFTPTRYGEFLCDVCGGTGEAAMENIIEHATEEHEWRELQT